MSKLGKLLHLLYDAHNRVRTVHGLYEFFEDGELSDKAFRRDFPKDPEWEEFERRRPTIRPTESTAELWFEWPERLRQDTRSSRDGDGNILLTRDGEFWEYFPESGVNRKVGGHPRHVAGIDIFDPAFLLTDLRLELRGRTSAAGREAISVSVRPRPSMFGDGFAHLDLLDEIVVDTERGTLLAATWRMEGEEMRRFRFSEIAFDEPIDPDTFAPDVPLDPRAWGDDFPKPVRVTIEEGAARASFPVWALPSIPEAWTMEAWHLPFHPERPESFRITYARHDATAHLTLEEQSAAIAKRDPERVDETIERNGRRIDVLDKYRGGRVELELEGTHIRIHSPLPLERLLDVAVKLVRVGGSRRND